MYMHARHSKTKAEVFAKVPIQNLHYGSEENQEGDHGASGRFTRGRGFATVLIDHGASGRFTRGRMVKFKCANPNGSSLSPVMLASCMVVELWIGRNATDE